MMRKAGTYFLAAISACFIINIISCTDGSCYEETNAFMKASFYAEGKPLAPDSLTISGIDRNTAKIYNKAKGILQAKLPLDASSDNCRFAVRINGISDTVTLYYLSYPHLISKECGYTFFQTIDSVVTTKNIVDTIRIRNNTISIINEENIRIFY